jgi:hypothetical protein
MPLARSWGAKSSGVVLLTLVSRSVRIRFNPSRCIDPILEEIATFQLIVVETSTQLARTHVLKSTL